jgi:GntR family transcriptional regulator / MocR family aminotransferase
MPIWSRSWSPPVPLDPASATPLFLQLARAIADEVLRGRLRPGDPLPGSRTLADQLSVHRSTVVAAYAELAAQGWTRARPGGATTVAETSPDIQPRPFSSRARPRRGIPSQPGFPLPPPRLDARPDEIPSRPGTLELWGGVPDLRLLSTAPLGRALRRAARLHGRTLLAYAAESNGHPALRQALATMLSATRGLAAGPEDLLVTHGSQMALDLVARTLLGAGDVVAVEAIGYRPAWGAFQRTGARLAPIPVDAEGLRVSALERVAGGGRLRAVYVTPHHQYPTTAVLSPRRRLALLELARRHRFAIVEDDYDHEFHYDGRPVLPLASADRDGQVIYIGTLAKILAPGLRIGFLVAPAELLRRLADERFCTDRQGNLLVEAAAAELLEDGEVARHTRRTRRIYHARRDALVASLRRHLGDSVSFSVPAGGMALWVRAARGIDVEAWRRRALEQEVMFQTGGAFTFDGSALPFVRLGFALCDERELDLAARRMARALPR